MNAPLSQNLALWNWQPIDWLNHLWQSTVVALVLLLLIAACSKLSAHTRRTLGWMALAKFVLPLALFSHFLAMFGVPNGWLESRALKIPVNSASSLFTTAPVDLSVSQPEIPVALTTPEIAILPSEGTPTASTIGPAAISTHWISWRTAILCTWFAGFAALFISWIVRSARLHRKILAEASPAGAAMELRLATAAARGGFSLPARRLVIDGGHGPGVLGIFSPALILPQGLEDSLAPAELEAVLLHELIHLQRRDNLAGAVKAFAVSLLWFNPVVWLISRRIAVETEKSCDEKVLDITGDPDTYAGSIVKAARFSLGITQPILLGVVSPPVVARLENILAHGTRRDRPLVRLAVTMFGAALLVLGGHTGLTAATTSPGAPSESPKQETPAKKVEIVDVVAQLEAAKRELATLHERYRESHPRVQEQLRRIVDLENQLEAQKASAPTSLWKYVPRAGTEIPLILLKARGVYSLEGHDLNRDELAALLAAAVAASPDHFAGALFADTSGSLWPITEVDDRLKELNLVSRVPKSLPTMRLVHLAPIDAFAPPMEVHALTVYTADRFRLIESGAIPVPQFPPSKTGLWSDDPSLPVDRNLLVVHNTGNREESPRRIGQAQPPYLHGSIISGDSDRNHDRVEFGYIVDFIGKVQNVHVISSTMPDVDPRLLQAIIHTTFEPGRSKDGAPVSMSLTAAVQGRLQFSDRPPPPAPKISFDAAAGRFMFSQNENVGAPVEPDRTPSPAMEGGAFRPNETKVVAVSSGQQAAGTHITIAQPEQVAIPPGDGPPVLLSQVGERPPENLNQTGGSNTVQVGLIVDSTGTPQQVRVISSSDRKWEFKAVEIVKNWKFQAETKNGRAVATMMQYTLRFGPDGEATLVPSAKSGGDPSGAAPAGSQDRGASQPGETRIMPTVVEQPIRDAEFKGEAVAKALQVLDESSAKKQAQGIDHVPLPLSMPGPVYPDALLKGGVTGVVVVGYIVDIKGAVRQARVIVSTTHELEQPALAAVGDWKFAPGQKGGIPVNTLMQTAVVFDDGEHAVVTDTGQAGIPSANTVKTISVFATMPQPDSGPGPVFDINQLDQLPQATLRTAPAYPDAMKQSGIDGTVVVGFIVDSNGDVKEAHVITSTQREFEENALGAVRTWKFRPGKIAGNAVAMQMQVPLNFTISD